MRTMGRWFSDCYRLYVRACFSQTLEWEWTQRACSTVVDASLANLRRLMATKLAS